METSDGIRKHKERVSWDHFRQAPGGSSSEHGHKSGNRWLCSRGRRRAEPVPPEGNVESCPCIDHLTTEEANRYNIHPSGAVLPLPVVLSLLHPDFS